MGAFFIRNSSDNQFYFVLVANNHEIIATSEMYTTKSDCENGIDAVKANAPNAIVIDVAD